MEAIGETSIPAIFLNKHGEGLHHISLESGNIVRVCANFGQCGVQIIGNEGNQSLHIPRLTDSKKNKEQWSDKYERGDMTPWDKQYSIGVH
jgi:hypothetical protein